MADSLVGGDLAGLHHMVSTMQAAPEEMRGVVAALSSGVDSLVGHAGWNGAAADNFRKAWSSDSISAGALSQVVSGVGGTIDTLVTALDALNTSWATRSRQQRLQGFMSPPTGRSGPSSRRYLRTVPRTRQSQPPTPTPASAPCWCRRRSRSG